MTLSNIKKIKRIQCEDDIGNTEYKYKLTGLNKDQVTHLATQLKYRICQGDNQAIYKIGISNDGLCIGISEKELSESLKFLNEISVKAGACICNVTKTEMLNDCDDNSIFKINGKTEIIPEIEIITDESNEKKKRYIAEVLIRMLTDDGYLENRIVVGGSVDSGKSTLIGVLTESILDNGRGLARESVFNHKHERENGRTSSIGVKILGFNKTGESVSDVLNIKKLTWEDIVKNSTKIISFYDLCGHSIYTKTTILGISSNRPDYAIIIIGGNTGLLPMTKEHLNIVIQFRIPIILIITKLDITPSEILQSNIDTVKKFLSRENLTVYNVNNDDDIDFFSKNITKNKCIPLFKISNVSGVGIDNLKKFLNLLPIRKRRDIKDNNVKFQIQDIFQITGFGTVVGGLLMNGIVEINTELLIGPDIKGEFQKIRVRTIECKRVRVTKVTSGKYVCICIQGIDKNLVRKGMFLVSEKLNPRATWEFTAKIYITTGNSVHITDKYQVYMHIGHVNQTCQIIEIINIQYGKKHTDILKKNNTENKFIGPGDTADVRIKFCFRPELIFKDQRIIIREGLTRGIGIITDINYDILHQPLTIISNKFNKKTKN